MLRKGINEECASLIIIALTHCICVLRRVFIDRLDRTLRQLFRGLHLLLRLQAGELRQILLRDLRIRTAQDLLCLRRQIFPNLNVTLNGSRRYAHLLGGILGERLFFARQFVARRYIVAGVTRQIARGRGRVQRFVNFLPPRQQLAQFQVGEASADHVLVDLRQLCVKPVQPADGTLHFCLAQQLRGLQTMKSHDKGVISIHGDRIRHADLRDALRKPLHIFRRGLAAPRVDFNIVDIDKYWFDTSSCNNMIF